MANPVVTILTAHGWICIHNWQNHKSRGTGVIKQETQHDVANPERKIGQEGSCWCLLNLQKMNFTTSCVSDGTKHRKVYITSTTTHTFSISATCSWSASHAGESEISLPLTLCSGNNGCKATGPKLRQVLCLITVPRRQWFKETALRHPWHEHKYQDGAFARLHHGEPTPEDM